MPKLLDQEIKNNFEKAMLAFLQNDNSGIFSNEGRFNEPRVVADNVQEICKQNFHKCFPKGIITSNFSNNLSRRAMGDIEVIDCDGVNYYIDVKTHNLGTNFNMPNLTSIDRLSKYYSNPVNYFFILVIEYDINESGINFQSVKLFPIEYIAWECLRIGALGKGQIQIKNSNKIITNPELTRKDWMKDFYKNVNDYYNTEIKKAQERQKYMQEQAHNWK